MARGHWGPGARFRRRRVEIEFGGPTGQEVSHVGIGYEVVAEDGTVLQQKGWTWHSPGEAAEADRLGRPLLGAEHRAAPDDARLAHKLADLVARRCMEFEGLTQEAPPPEWLTAPHPPAWTPEADERVATRDSAEVRIAREGDGR